MRRFKQMLAQQAAKEILLKSTNGVLSLIDPVGEPYGVPVSYVYDGDSSIYFHSAAEGYKIDCVVANGDCSFCVIGQDLIMPEEFTSYFRSVIVKGKIHIVANKEEVEKGLMLLCDKYSPGVDPEQEISRCLRHVAVLRLDIETMTGKEAIELVRMRVKP
ncbi:MAG: pyridoxamine 5'-phosphate oxidase family protein [Paramuribaculum sp.]|nr:pyridoxamine 5'-phosphate oxidase family protein [Paramuribaculum sp.]